MMIWIIFLAMTAAAVMAVLWPLSRLAPSPASAIRTRSSIASRSPRSSATVSAARSRPPRRRPRKAEAGRRLLRASDGRRPCAVAVGEPALRRRRAASALALSLVPILALAVYGALRLAATAWRSRSRRASRQPADRLDLGAAIAQIETHLAAEPAGRPRLGRRRAGLSAPRPHRRRGEGLRGGPAPSRPRCRRVSPITARPSCSPRTASCPRRRATAFEQALEARPGSAKARFYLARAAEQDGRSTRRRQDYAALLAASPADAPWVPVVREQLARLDGRRRRAGAAPRSRRRSPAWSRASRAASSQGGTAEEWARLMRSYTVLGERDKAAAAAAPRRARRSAPDKAGLETHRHAGPRTSTDRRAMTAIRPRR